MPPASLPSLLLPLLLWLDVWPMPYASPVLFERCCGGAGRLWRGANFSGGAGSASNLPHQWVSWPRASCKGKHSSVLKKGMPVFV